MNAVTYSKIETHSLCCTLALYELILCHVKERRTDRWVQRRKLHIEK